MSIEMSKEGQNLEQAMARVKNFKFEDDDRREQYKKLLVGLKLIVEENTFDAIWEDAGLLGAFQQKLEAIMVLMEKPVWTYDQCVEWAKEANLDKHPAKYVKDNFVFVDNHIEVHDDLDLNGSQVEVLPVGLTVVKGSLWVQHSTIRELPSTLVEVTGSIYLQNSKIRRLPDSLKIIGDYLDMVGSLLEDVNETLEIDGAVYARGKPKKLVDKLLRMKDDGKIMGDIISSD